MKPLPRRLFWTVVLALPWWVFTLAGLGYVLPEGWGQTMWGPIATVLLALLALVLVYWGITIHERKTGQAL